jgi:predicted naringenin-chalcone synthase
MVSVAGLGLAYPGDINQREVWDGYFDRHYGGVQRGLAKRIFEHSGVTSRHGAINPLIEDVSGWSTQARMRRYLTEALPLGKDAVGSALGAADLAPADVGLFAVCSCTGYVTPGLDILLARDLGMSPRTQRLFIGHMGCYAALPGLGTVTDFVAARGKPAVLLCLELTSLHVQPASKDPQQIVAHALFSDAAAAVVLRPSLAGHQTSSVAGNQTSSVAGNQTSSVAGNQTSSVAGQQISSLAGHQILETTAVTDTSTADHMTWDVTDLGFRMGLSPKVPSVLSLYVADLVNDLLDRHGLTVGDIDGWAVHPGGPKILDVVRDCLGLPESAIAESRETLATHGNCSSATVLMIIDALRRRPAGPPRRIVALAFGPGLTLYATLMTL